MSILESPRFTLQASASLFNDKPHYASVRLLFYFELVKTPQTEPLNREEELLQKFSSIVKRRNPGGSHQKKRTLLGRG